MYNVHNYIIQARLFVCFCFDRFSDVTVVLKYPYPRDIEEQHVYTELHHHAVTKMVDLDKDSDSGSSIPEDNVSWDACDTLRRLPYTTPVRTNGNSCLIQRKHVLFNISTYGSSLFT